MLEGNHGEYTNLERLSTNSSKYLVTMPYGIGDAVYLGLTAVDQILKNNPTAQVDVLCNPLQATILEDDPRITPIIVPRDFSFTADRRTWYKIAIVTKLMRSALSTLREKEYAGVFPGSGAFGFLRALKAPIMTPRLNDILRDYQTIRHFQDAPASKEVRQIVNRFFGDVLPAPDVTEATPLYIKISHYQEARNILNETGDIQKHPKTILISPDTASDATRPPTELLSSALKKLMQQNPDAKVIILPSYTDNEASERLARSLIVDQEEFAERIYALPAEPKYHLLTITALADLCDVVITGDTGTMQLAASQRRVIDQLGQQVDNVAKNKRNTVAIFGATNPGLYGHPERMVIVGRGRKSQRRLIPGFFKEGYNPRGRDFFDHIHSDELVSTVNTILSPRKEPI